MHIRGVTRGGDFKLGNHPDFSDLVVSLPCCRARRSLDDLDYRFPAGFARFVLEAYEPANATFLAADALAELEHALGTPVRQVLARI